MKKTYYCTRGCNVFETETENPECAACEPKRLKDERGYFIGMDYRGVNRLSVEYWTTKEAADYALKYGRWTPRHPKSNEWEWGD